jgi:hypothetical protein
VKCEKKKHRKVKNQNMHQNLKKSAYFVKTAKNAISASEMVTYLHLKISNFFKTKQNQSTMQKLSFKQVSAFFE